MVYHLPFALKRLNLILKEITNIKHLTPDCALPIKANLEHSNLINNHLSLARINKHTNVCIVKKTGTNCYLLGIYMENNLKTKEMRNYLTMVSNRLNPTHMLTFIPIYKKSDEFPEYFSRGQRTPFKWPLQRQVNCTLLLSDSSFKYYVVHDMISRSLTHTTCLKLNLVGIFSSCRVSHVVIKL